jgi:hypothetical protein
MISPNGDCHPVKGFNDFNGPAQTTNLGQRTQIAAQQRTIAWISTTAIGAKRPFIRKTAFGPIPRQMV